MFEFKLFSPLRENLRMRNRQGVVHIWRHGLKGYQGFCDNSTKALVLKCVTMGDRGVKNDQKLRDAIYGRPPKSITLTSEHEPKFFR